MLCAAKGVHHQPDLIDEGIVPRHETWAEAIASAQATVW